MNYTVSQDDMDAIKWILEHEHNKSTTVHVGLDRQFYTGMDMFLCTVKTSTIYVHGKTYSDCIKAIRNSLECAETCSDTDEKGET